GQWSRLCGTSLFISSTNLSRPEALKNSGGNSGLVTTKALPIGPFFLLAFTAWRRLPKTWLDLAFSVPSDSGSIVLTFLSVSVARSSSQLLKLPTRTAISLTSLSRACHWTLGDPSAFLPHARPYLV